MDQQLVSALVHMERARRLNNGYSGPATVTGLTVSNGVTLSNITVGKVIGSFDQGNIDRTATSGNECSESHHSPHVDTAADRADQRSRHHGSPEAQRARLYRDRVALANSTLPKTGGQRTRAMSAVAAVTVALGVSLLSIARIGRPTKR